MIDQLHLFPDQAAAEAAFPRPVDDEGNPMTVPCWMAGNATVMPVTVEILRDGAVAAANGYWMGVTTPADGADNLWALPSAMVEMASPSQPILWTETVIRTRLDMETASTVVGVTPIFGGRPYQFAERPAEPEINE